MGENSTIQWTDHTFNPWIGCAKVSPGCAHCYAEELMDTRYGRAKWGQDGTRVRTSVETWRDPLKWNRSAGNVGQRARVFCASLADVFEDRPELQPWRADLFRLIDSTPNLDWLLLTKRPENIGRMWHTRSHVEDGGLEWGKSEPTAKRFKRDNVWLGTSIEDQERWDARVPELLRYRDLAAVLFLSAEPLLGKINAGWRGQTAACERCSIGIMDAMNPHVGGACTCSCHGPRIDWVIIGGESGRQARPCDVEHIRDLKRQCVDADVRVFIKQLGANCGYTPAVGEWLKGHRNTSADESGYSGVRRLKDPKGGDPTEWPADLQVREMPEPVLHTI